MKRGWLGCAALAAGLWIGCAGEQEEQAGSSAVIEETRRGEAAGVQAQWADDEKEVYDENFGRGASSATRQRPAARSS